MEEAGEWKEKGTAAFRQQRWEEAQGCYQKALDALESVRMARLAIDSASGLKSHLDPQAAADLETSCRLNICSCGIKMQNWEEVYAHASSVILNDADNVKARFRRGRCLKELGRLKEAKDDLLVAAQKQPANKEVRELYNNVKEALKVAKTAKKGKGFLTDGSSGGLYAENESVLRDEEKRKKEDKIQQDAKKMQMVTSAQPLIQHALGI